MVPLGAVIIIIGFVILLAGIVSQVQSGKSKVEGGGVIFIGPIPVFGAATSKEVFYILIAVSVILIIAFLLLRRNF